MHIYQEVLNSLESEMHSILEAGGYNPKAAVVKIYKEPGRGWRYEASAALEGMSLRKVLIGGADAAKTADEFLTLLRERVGISQLQTA